MGKPYILTYSSLRRSASLLAERLGMDLEYFPRSDAPAIRWANPTGNYRNETLYNHRDIILQISNKNIFSRFLTERQIPHVQINTGVPEKFPVAVRTILGGSQGAGIIVCRDEESFRSYRGNYWSPWYYFEAEYGVHVLGGNIVKIFRKEWVGGGEEPEFPLKNTGRGYGYRRVNMEGRFKKLASYVQSIYDVLPINLCRFDVGFDSVSRQYLVIEGNTAPGLSENVDTFNLYLDYLGKNILERRV